MEIFETLGLRILLDTVMVRRGDVWSSVVEPGIWLGAVLEGQVEVRQSLLGHSVWDKGNATAFSATRPVETDHHALADGPVSAVFVQLDRDNASHLLGADAIGAIEQAHTGGRLRVTPAASATAWQMFGCPLQGTARRLYMTGKALEMVAHLLPEDGEARPAHPGRWSARDVECFHAARAILMAELANPPSVPELARRVGTNARKLGAGFVDLFGLPVYAFAKAQRLDTARLMLEAGETSIARVAQSFGYQPAHFATEFRKRFGLSPTEITGKRRDL